MTDSKAALDDLLFSLDWWGNLHYEEGCKYAHDILLEYREVISKSLTNAPEVVTFDEFQVWVDTHSLMYDFLSTWEKRFPNGIKIVREK